MTQTKREGFWLWTAFTILVGVAGLGYRSLDAALETLGWVEHASAVLRQVEDVSAVYGRAVSARRLYLVTGDASQLPEVPELDARMKRAVDAVRASVQDNPGQAARAADLERALHDRLAALDAAVLERRAGASSADTAESLALASRIRAVREDMEAEENRLLAERDARTRADMSRTKIAGIGGLLAGMGILLWAFRRLRHEVARRRRSEGALRASEGFLDSIVENLPDMVFVKRAGDLRFERINRAGEELLGAKRADMLGKNDFDFFPADQAASFQERDRTTLREGVVVDVPEEPIDTRTGRRWLHTKKVPILDEAGAPAFLLGISSDITDQREAASRLRTAKDAAEAANQELQSFSYAVAHDLRAPLRAIDGFSHALLEDCADKLDAEGMEYLTRVREAARRMGQLIDGLLELARLTRTELLSQDVDLTALARDAAARLRAANPQRQVELRVEEGLTARGDPRLLAAALDNLLGNAWKFTGKRESASIEVGSEREVGEPSFFVRDNGAGFDQAYAHRLFGAFQRLHDASEFEGSGIGLATVQRIVRRHGGKIWAEGEVGRGATIRFTLPPGSRP